MSQDDEDLELARRAIDGSAAALLNLIDRRSVRALGRAAPPPLSKCRAIRKTTRWPGSRRLDGRKGTLCGAAAKVVADDGTPLCMRHAP